jgi:MFS family permease
MWAAAWIVVAVFVLSNAPTPLYVHWQTTMGFSTGMLTEIFAAYILGLLLTLPIAGQLSDRFGRKPVLLPGLMAAIIASCLFADAHTVEMLLIARFLSGVAVGVVVSAGMASVVELGGPDRRRQASLIASVSMVAGAGLGPVLAGGLALSLQAPVVPIFAVNLAILLSATLVAALLPLKHRKANSDESWRLHLPSVPRANHRHLAFGIAIFGPGITAVSFVLSLGPELLSRLLDVTSPLIAGAMAGAMFLTATGVQFAARRFSIRTIFLVGAISTVFSMVGIVFAVLSLNAAALIIAALLAGSGQGLGQLGGLTLIGLHVPDTHRAEANAVLSIGGYIPAGLMPVATGLIIDHVGLSTGATLFAIVLAAIAISGGGLVARRLVKD